ncbi:MAG TPA: zinc-binding dehydrogenase [Thermoanaerobaculia bacterium]
MASRAWFVDRYGGPERLRLRRRDDAAPGGGEVAIRTAAIALNFADLFARAGVYPNTPRPPFVPGMEISGVVESVGPGVTSLSPGQSVVAVPIFGGYAERVVCRASSVLPIPDGSDLVEAAAMPVAFLTARYAIDRAQVRNGEIVVVTGAGGGVGTALLQLLSLRGAKTVALVGSETKFALCRELGADRVGLYAAAGRRDALASDRPDVVIDAIGGAIFRPLWRGLARGGRYVLYGFAAASGKRGVARLRALSELSAMGLLVPFAFVSSCRTLVGFNLSLLPNRSIELREAATEIFREWKAGRIRPVLGSRFDFGDLPDAHRALASRKTRGKVVVSVGIGSGLHLPHGKEI